MPHTFHICIDEAGDDGLRFSRLGCSRWFIIAGAVVVKHSLPRLDAVLRELKRDIHWKERKPLHFRDVTDANRPTVINRLSTCGMGLFRGIAVLVHKPSLCDPEGFREKHRLYFYFTRYLLERASWLCRDAPAARRPGFGNRKARLVFSSRNDLPYDELHRYLELLKTKDTSIAWGSLDTCSSLILTNGKHSGLQVADSIASSFFCANHEREDLRCSTWAENLKPVMYSRDGQHRSYGVKIFPREIESQIAQGTLAPWANIAYPT